MAKIRIYAHACEFTGLAPRRCLSYMPMAPALVEQIIDVKTVGQVHDAIAAMNVHTDGSYFKDAFLLRGERAPNGYRQARFKVEVDRDQ